tara:strand:+ start:21103 stop:21705 length:603 start_codon:yes stop_codon:yes gene_type:complete
MLHIVLGYGLFIVAAVLSIVNESNQDDWLSLLTNGAIGLTAFYAYTVHRTDISIIGFFTMCTSLVWHSSSHYGLFDQFASRYLAYYAFGTTIMEPTVIGPPAMFLSVLFTYYEQFEELYMAVPIIIMFALYKAVKHTIGIRFIAAIVVAGAAMYCKRLVTWHSLWHVGASISVALLCTETPPKTPLKLATPINEKIQLRF